MSETTLSEGQRIKALRDAGEAAQKEGLLHTTCPYNVGLDRRADEWLHGWWRASYAQKDKDKANIARWLSDNADGFYSDEVALAVAQIIVQSYDRTLPISGNVIGIYKFDIPAPITLENYK